jgi:capsular polysaccharide biosynthesis protein
MLNEPEVTAALEQCGFVVIAPEQMEADAIATMLRDARVVVGVEGSALTHAAVAADRGACIFAIQSPTAFNSFYRLVTSAAGQHFAFSVGDPVEGERFTMPVDRLLRSIALVEAELP